MVQLPSFPHKAKTEGSDPLGNGRLIRPELDDKHREMIRQEAISRGMVDVFDGY